MRKSLNLFILLTIVLSAVVACANMSEFESESASSLPPVQTIAPPSVQTEQPAMEPSPSPEQTAPAAEPASSPEITASPETASPPEPNFTRNDAYFNSALFLGDSVIEALRQYVAKQRKIETTLGEAKFLASTIGITLSDLVGDRKAGIMYSYKGVEKPVRDIVAEMGVTRIFVMIGLNDLSESEPVITDIINRYSRFIDLLQDTVKGVDIIVLTSTPKTKTSWLPSYTANRNFSNALINDFTAELIAMCDTRGIACIDVNTLLKDENGVLPDDCSRDDFVHINDKGSKIVVDALYDFAADKN